jgi:serine/threonine protein kinase
MFDEYLDDPVEVCKPLGDYSLDEGPNFIDQQLQSRESLFVRPSDPVQDFFGRSRLSWILSAIGKDFLIASFEEAGVSDIWLPLSKQTLFRILGNRADEQAFSEKQAQVLSMSWEHDTNCYSRHYAFEDGDELIPSESIIGEGGFSIVERIALPAGPSRTPCVRKRIGRSKQLNAQKQVMAAFTREIKVMHLVRHHHCVRFLGSYTDYDNLAIISSPVADMDLAAFLDFDTLTSSQSLMLRSSMGCLASGLLYLHDHKIRYVLNPCIEMRSREHAKMPSIRFQ